MRFISTVPHRDRVGLRVYEPGDVLPGSLEPSLRDFAVEWAGAQGGHPSSYAMIGGHLQKEGLATDVGALQASGSFRDALPSARVDDVRFGLPEEYRRAVFTGVDRGGSHLVVSVAAHGYAGSSAMAFRWVSELLSVIAGRLGKITDVQIEEAWAAIKRPAN